MRTVGRPFVRRLRRAFLAVCLLAVAGAGQLAAQAPVVTKVLDAGSSDTHINIVILSEGFTEAELPGKFASGVQGLLNAFFEASIYKEYKSCFNAYSIAVASNQSGASHYTPSVVISDTYFHSAFDSYGIQRLITIPPNDHDNNYNDGAGKVMSLLKAYVPDYDLVMLLVNDSAYGGSGGFPLITSTNQNSAEIVRHESGHSFGHLGDEYSDPYPGYPDAEEPNTTTQTSPALIKWAAWIASDTPIPTPAVASESRVVGLFEGAHYHATGWYRPKLACRMGTFGQEFCEVCNEALVLATYRKLRPIETFSPSSLKFSATPGTNLAFSVTKRVPATHRLQVQWSVDGVPVADATGDAFRVSTLGPGAHSVVVAVNDPTPLVRNDPTGLLRDSKTWSVQVAAAAPTFFNGATDVGGGFSYLPTFGYFKFLPQSPGYVYHNDLGFLYYTDANDGRGGIYFYDFATTSGGQSLGFFYTSPGLFPYLYSFGLNTFVYYFPEAKRGAGFYTTAPRVFSRLDTGEVLFR